MTALPALTGKISGGRPWSWIKIALLVLVALLLVYLYLANSS